jgi:hypothetical protein
MNHIIIETRYNEVFSVFTAVENSRLDFLGDKTNIVSKYECPSKELLFKSGDMVFLCKTLSLGLWTIRDTNLKPRSSNPYKLIVHVPEGTMP